MSTPVPVPYHRLYRAQPQYRWWRPLVALVVLAVTALVASLAVTVVLMAVGVIVGEFTFADVLRDPERFARIDASSPFDLVLALLGIVVWLPCIPLALLAAGIRPSGLRTNIVHSVAFRLRLGWLARCLVPATAVTVLSVGGSVAVGAAFGEGLHPFTTPLPRYLVVLALILLLVPFQAAAEEYVFRGVVVQAIGAWVRWLPVGALVSTAVFAALHIYDVWGLVDVAVFAIAAVIATWRTGGLEAAIALHAVNNVVAFGLLASGVLGTTRVEAEGGSALAVGFSVVAMAVYVLWVDRMAARRGIRRAMERHDPGPPPGMPGPPPGMPGIAAG